MKTPVLSRRAFTLVELLAVIAIVAMLASVLWPVGRQMLGRARASQCASQLRQLGQAVQLYAQENSQRMPSIEPLPSMPVDAMNPQLSMGQALLKYLDNDVRVLRCPRDKTRWPAEGQSYMWSYPYSNDLVDAPQAWVHKITTDKATLMWDYDNVHSDQGGKYSKNVLYADGHVSPL